MKLRSLPPVPHLVLSLTALLVTTVPACSPATTPTDDTATGGSGAEPSETGGANGSGGEASGSGGATATGGDSSTGGTSSLPAEAILFQEDFETTPEDSVPEDWDSYVSFLVNRDNSKDLAQYALADSTKAHRGSMALHVKGLSQPAMITRPLPEGIDEVYVRAYVWLTAELGQNPTHNHDMIIGLRGTPGRPDSDVHFGEAKGAVGTFQLPSDRTSPPPALRDTSPIIPAGRWNCIEVAFRATSDNHELQAWLDGDEVHLIDDPNDWDSPGDPEFLSGKFEEVIIGWYSYSNYANEVWFDDIVVATQPVGCD